MAGKHDIYVDQGTDYGVEIFYKIDGVTVNLTGYSAAMQVRAAVTSASPVLTFGVGTGLTMGGVAGTVTLAVTDAQTTAIPAGAYVYDLELTAANGTITRMMQGAFYIDGEVTR